MPDVIAVLLVALEHAELGPMTITYETGQSDLDAGVATRNGVGGPLDGDDLRTARCAALRDYRLFVDRLTGGRARRALSPSPQPHRSVVESAPMTGSDDHQVQIIASTLDEIRNVLGTTGDLEPGAEIAVGDGLVLRAGRVSRSSGFDGTQYLLEGVMTVVTGTGSGGLTAWLMDRLQDQDRVTAIVDGEEVGAVPPGERS